MNGHRAGVHRLGVKSLNVHPSVEGGIGRVKDMETEIDEVVAFRTSHHATTKLVRGFVEATLVAASSQPEGREARQTAADHCDAWPHPRSADIPPSRCKT